MELGSVFCVALGAAFQWEKKVQQALPKNKHRAGCAGVRGWDGTSLSSETPRAAPVSLALDRPISSPSSKFLLLD